jgi:hypothetical protein
MKKKLFFISALFSNIVFSMQEVEKAEKIFSKKKQIFNLVAPYGLDHESVCSLAATSKYYHNFVLALASNTARKLRCCPTTDNCFGNFTHKYGSARYYAYNNDSSGLVLGYHELNKKNDKFETFPSFTALPYKPKPFLNEKGTLSIYGHGGCLWNWGFASFAEIWAIWKFNVDGSMNMCVAQVKDEEPWDLSCLVSYPVFLKAILYCSGKSEIVKVVSQSEPKECWVFSFDDVIIPDNYNERVEFCVASCTTRKEGFYQNFPQYIKDAIEKQYEKCLQQR